MPYVGYRIGNDAPMSFHPVEKSKLYEMIHEKTPIIVFVRKFRKHAPMHVILDPDGNPVGMLDDNTEVSLVYVA